METGAVPFSGRAKGTVPFSQKREKGTAPFAPAAGSNGKREGHGACRGTGGPIPYVGAKLAET